MNYIDFAKKKGSITTGNEQGKGEFTQIERKGQTIKLYRDPTKGYVITGNGDGNDKKAWNMKQVRKAANYYSSHPYATMKDVEKHAGGKKKKDKGAWNAAMYEPSIPVDDNFDRRDGLFRAADGSWKVRNIVGFGLPAAAAIAALAKVGIDKYRTRNDAKKVSSFSEDNYMNYSGNLDDIFIGNDGVAIVGDGAAEALFSTLGDLTKYAENNDSLISAGVDAIRAAQFSKLENHEYFGETDSVSLDECPYRVGDTLEVAPNFGGTVVEVMPLPESFCDDTVSSQIRLDNGAICNVTPSGSIWLEMSENGDFVTTPLIKYNNIRVGDKVFSTYDLGLVANEEDANFGIEDYIGENENFNGWSSVPGYGGWQQRTNARGQVEYQNPAGQLVDRAPGTNPTVWERIKDAGNSVGNAVSNMWNGTKNLMSADRSIGGKPGTFSKGIGIANGQPVATTHSEPNIVTDSGENFADRIPYGSNDPQPQGYSEDQISNDYKIGVSLVEQSPNFSEEDIASFSNANNLNFSEVAQGYVDAINYVSDMQNANTETTNFSAPQVDPGRVTNFSAQDYNNTLSEISSWTTDLTI